MDIDKLKKDIKDAEQVIFNKKEYIAATKQAIAEHLCPFKAGDLVLNDKGEEEIIGAINYCGWNGIGYDFMVRKIKKNGQPYKDLRHTYSEENYTAATKEAQK